MISDLEEFDDDVTCQGDVCVVGGGAVGLVVAVQLSRMGKRVILLEGGGVGLEERSQALQRTITAGHPSKRADFGRCRCRCHCGCRCRAESGGNSRICIQSDCSTVLFPRVDPAIIVLVRKQDCCLLGRQSSWPENRYSTIAGFVEPGESLEDAVRREVREETNIVTGNIEYHSSQPWPFPSSLMLGFTAEALSSEILLNDRELEDAQWFTRKQLRSGFPKLPYRLSIARRLVDDWLTSDSDETNRGK